MRYLLAGLLPMFLLSAGCMQQKSDVPASSVSFADQFKAIEKEFQDAVSAFEEKMETAKTNDERKAIVKAHRPNPKKFLPRMNDVAKKAAGTPDAVDPLLWIVMHAPDAVETNHALDTLRKDHATSDKLQQLVKMLGEDSTPTALAFLKEVKEKSPNKDIQAWAAYSLGEFYRNLADLQPMLVDPKTEPKMIDAYKKELTLAWFNEVKASEPKVLYAKAKPYYQEVADKFADVPFPNSHKKPMTLGNKAKGAIFEMAHLQEGMPAPELTAVDLEGKSVNLSSFKDKIVVVDFWATWCGPCRALIPHEKQMMKKLSGKPVEMVYVSVDDTPEEVKEFLEKNPLPWHQWFSGYDGPAYRAWNVRGFPTIYVIDAKGVIRYRNTRGATPEEIETAVDAVVADLEKK